MMTNFDINDLWIPMTRKKPEVCQLCLISTKEWGVKVGIFFDDGKECHIWNSSKNLLKGIFCKYYFYALTQVPGSWYTMKEVDAWMPMPATYTKKGAKR